MENLLIISFLDKLRRTDTRAFVFVMLFMFLQLFLTFIKLEVPPFFLYGMYSEKFAVTDTFTTLKILVNDKPLQYYQPPMRERYLLEETAGNFEAMKANDYTDVLKTRIESKYPFVYNSAAYPFISGKIYNTARSIHNYKSWLRQKCLRIAGMENGKVKIVRTTFLLDKNTLQLNPVKNEILEDI